MESTYMGTWCQALRLDWSMLRQKNGVFSEAIDIYYKIFLDNDPYLVISIQSTDKPFPMRSDCNFYGIQPNKKGVSKQRSREEQGSVKLMEVSRSEQSGKDPSSRFCSLPSCIVCAWAKAARRIPCGQITLSRACRSRLLLDFPPFTPQDRMVNDKWE